MSRDIDIDNIIQSLNNWVIILKIVFTFSSLVSYNCNISIWNWSNMIKNLVSTVDSHGLVFKHQDISSYSADYASMLFQLFMGLKQL